MNFNDYQEQTSKTRMSSTYENKLVYPVLGLMGEAGELSGKVSKILRDQNGEVAQDNIDYIKKEVGDCLWFLSEICTDLGISLNDAASSNLDKLKDRMKRNVISGSGDDR